MVFRFRNEQDGVMALEACISLTLFLIVMLVLYSVIQMFTVQSMISHAAQEACQSIAFENYSQSTFSTGTLQQIPTALITLIKGGFENDYYKSADFTAETFFEKLKKESTEEKTQRLQMATESVAQKRFAAYLGGGTDEANELLKNYGVVNGLEGVSFNGTNKSSTDMTIQITYKIRLLFYIEMFHFGEFESTQKVCCRLWK